MKDPNAKRIQVVDDINKLMSEVTWPVALGPLEEPVGC